MDVLAARWSKDAPAIMKDAYRMMVGLKIPDSWSWEVRKSAMKLALLQAERGEKEVERFLNESMVAFVLRCGGSYQVQPGSPFFADSYLFSESALDYLEKHQRRVRKYAYLSADPQAFPTKVFEEMLQSEIDYWSLGTPNTPPALDLTHPGLYWILLSSYFGRFGTHLPLDQQWVNWQYEVDYMGRGTPVMEAWGMERVRLQKDRHLAAAAETAAADAIWEASLVTWQRYGLGTSAIDERRRVILPPEGEKLRKMRFHPGSGLTLWEWEINWRKYLCEKLGMEFDPDTFMGLSKHRRRPQPAVTAGLAGAINNPNGVVSGFMLRALDATEEE